MAVDLSSLLERIDRAETLMVQGDARAANELFAGAWNDVSKDAARLEAFGRTSAFWLLMSGREALFVLGRHQAVMTVCKMAADLFSNDGLVMGNPHFHLRAGQSRHLLSEGTDPEAGGTDLARALAAGGSEMFRGEEPRFFHLAASLVMPPAGLRNWEGPGLGTHVQLLNGVSPGGYLAAQFAEKFGRPPPYGPAN